MTTTPKHNARHSVAKASAVAAGSDGCGDFQKRITSDREVVGRYKIGRNTYRIERRMVERNVKTGPEERWFAMEYAGRGKWFSWNPGITGHIEGAATKADAMSILERQAGGKTIRPISQ